MATDSEEDMDYPEMDYFMNESLSDVVFVIEGQRLPAIKQTLSFKSRVFRAMFTGKFGNSKKSKKLPEIVVEDTTFDAFKTLIRFIYTEQLVLKDDNLQHICEVYQLSDRFEVLRLRQRVDQHFNSKLNVENLISISRIVFTLFIEKLMSKVMTFIESNINELIEWDIEELKELNDSTNDKLLDVLTGDHLKGNNKVVVGLTFDCDRGYKEIWVKREVFITSRNKHVIFFAQPRQKYRRTRYEYNVSFDAMKAFIGYIYFDKLILEDNEDFQVIRQLCGVIQRYNFSNIFVGNYLKNRITVENWESISAIAFDYKIEELKEKIISFIETNFDHLVEYNVKEQVSERLMSKINLENVISISKLGFTHNIEQFIEKILAFIESNINHLVQRDVKQFRELNDSTNDKLLDVLTSDLFIAGQITVLTKDRVFTIKRELIIKENIFETNDSQTPDLKITAEDISFDAFKIFVGYLYFDKFILKTDTEIQTLREVCELSKRYQHLELLNNMSGIWYPLIRRLTVETLEQITGIALDYKINEVMKWIIFFTKKHCIKIANKSDDLLIKINECTDNSLLKELARYARNTYSELTPKTKKQLSDMRSLIQP